MQNKDGTNLLPLADFLQTRLQRDAKEPLNRQLYRTLRDAIIAGQLVTDRPLPPSRALAESLQIARNTVLHAYEQLVAEGYLQTRPGAGTFVSFAADTPPAAVSVNQANSAAPGLSQRGLALLDAMPQTGREYAAFSPGLPDLQAFPWPQWQRLLLQAHRDTPAADYGYRVEGGHAALKAALAQYLPLSRGVNCTADNILITGGTQQSFDLIARAVSEPGDTVWMEEPGYPGARMAWLANGLQLCATALDKEGLNWPALPGKSPRLIYVTPSHQYPLGSVMSLARRQALLAEAGRHGAWIVEDDYDSEFRHGGRPLAAMQGLDRNGQVLYLGTFSKVMFPALQLGYLVAPTALITPLRRLQKALWRESNYAQQAALAAFIDEGHFTAHLRRMRLLYAQRQEKLRNILADKLPGWPVHGGEAGMHMALQLPAGLDDQAISRELAALGVTAVPLSDYCYNTPPFPGLVLGYAGVQDVELVRAAVRMGQYLQGLA